MSTLKGPCFVFSAVLLFGIGHARAQSITGVPGSPSATMTIDGKQLPPADMPFGGKIERNALQSKPWWPPRVVPRKAPRTSCSS
jgi:arylsulfatase